MLRTAVNHVFRPLGGDLTVELPLLFDPANRDNLRVIVDPVPTAVLAHAGFVARDAWVLRRKVRVACIGAVFTAEQRRRRGLASRVLADALAQARPGRDLVLASGDGGLYRRQHMEPVPPLACFALPGAAGASGEAPAAVEMRRLPSPGSAGADATPAAEVQSALSRMRELYDEEPVHFVRSAGDWLQLWQAGRLVDAAATFTLLSRGGRTVAYAIAQNGRVRPGRSARARRIMEFAGDRDTILHAAPTLAEELLVPYYDTSTVNLCERRGWSRGSRQLLITAETLTTEVPVIPWYGLNYV